MNIDRRATRLITFVTIGLAAVAASGCVGSGAPTGPSQTVVLAVFDVRLVPAAQTGRVPVLEIAVPDALGLSARLQRGDPPVHLSERHAARGVLTLDPQVLLAEHDAPLVAALRTALQSTAA